MDVKRTLINLHKRFPDMSLEDLFAVLECVQEYETYVFPTTTTYKSDFITPTITSGQVLR